MRGMVRASLIELIGHAAGQESKGANPADSSALKSLTISDGT